uniref:Uncharacterized protein n=1 Tax=Romanomermis culicivorax TaxID=13658 RepID=A0A915JXF5_ROMCU
MPYSIDEQINEKDSTRTFRDYQIQGVQKLQYEEWSNSVVMINGLNIEETDSLSSAQLLNNFSDDLNLKIIRYCPTSEKYLLIEMLDISYFVIVCRYLGHPFISTVPLPRPPFTSTVPLPRLMLKMKHEKRLLSTVPLPQPSSYIDRPFTSTAYKEILENLK